MHRDYITSSSIRSIGYDPDRLLLEVEFVTGAVYQYFNVPETIYLEFITSDSKGRYFDYSIRDFYTFRKIK